MQHSAFNFFLVMLIEAISSVVIYLKDRLMGNLRPSSDDEWSNHPEFV
jgi:hypothetical protein